MALTEKQIDDLVEAILHGTQERYVQDMSDLMVDHLAQGFAKLSDEASLQQLAEIFPSQAQTILAKYQDAISDEVHAEVENALNDAATADLDQLKKIYGQERADVAEAYFAMGATAHFAALAKTTADQIADIVRRQNILMEQQAEQKWYQVSQDAINAVVLGTKPTEKALADGVVDLMNAGIMVIDYGRDGKATVSNMADVALRRHIVSQVSQVGGQMSLEAMQSYGHEFAITSAHFGARPSHAKWQGLPGCMSGEKTVDGTTYPDFYELTGYMGLRGPNVALGDRLKGVNCRHSMHPYFPGITQLPDREFKEAQAKYGKSSDEYYADLQRQRELERRIRKTKREIVGLERAGLGLESPTYVQKRLVLGKQQRTLNKHCKDNKLVRMYNREKAYGVSSQPRALTGKKWTSPATLIGRSLGAAAKTYEVIIPPSLTGLSKPIKTKTSEGKWISRGVLIAGKGHPSRIHSELDSLKQEYPDIPVEEWKKMAGNGWIDDLGISRRAELHWYECDGVRYARMKVKKFL